MAISVFAMAATTVVSLFLLYEYRLYIDKHYTFQKGRDAQILKPPRRSRFLLEANRKNIRSPQQQQFSKAVGNKSGEGAEKSISNEVKVEELSLSSNCDIFSGKWVHDDNYPLYASQQSCPYVSPQYSCKNNGRPDSDYLHWRWQPQDCNIPRFNAIGMLEILRGKRLMFVGDSLSRNQWESMVCMLQAVIPEADKSAQVGYPLATFKALNYNASVEFFWAPFLVDLDNAYVGNEVKRILRLDYIENNANNWRGVDILIFNSAHWWAHTGALKSWDYIQEGNYLYEDMDAMLAYANGMVSWANWIDVNINPLNQQVIFTSISPTHSGTSVEWNGQMCYNQIEPFQQNEINNLSPFPPQMTVVESILPQMTVHVSYLNITRLSDYRKDAHPSIYTNLSPQQRNDPNVYADCNHWCVSGLPDIWNELLFSMLQGL